MRTITIIGSAHRFCFVAPNNKVTLEQLKNDGNVTCLKLNSIDTSRDVQLLQQVQQALQMRTNNNNNDNKNCQEWQQLAIANGLGTIDPNFMKFLYSIFPNIHIYSTTTSKRRNNLQQQQNMTVKPNVAAAAAASASEEQKQDPEKSIVTTVANFDNSLPSILFPTNVPRRLKFGSSGGELTCEAFQEMFHHVVNLQHLEFQGYWFQSGCLSMLGQMTPLNTIQTLTLTGCKVVPPPSLVKKQQQQQQQQRRRSPLKLRNYVLYAFQELATTDMVGLKELKIVSTHSMRNRYPEQRVLKDMHNNVPNSAAVVAASNNTNKDDFDVDVDTVRNESNNNTGNSGTINNGHQQLGVIPQQEDVHQDGNDDDDDDDEDDISDYDTVDFEEEFEVCDSDEDDDDDEVRQEFGFFVDDADNDSVPSFVSIPASSSAADSCGSDQSVNSDISANSNIDLDGDATTEAAKLPLPRVVKTTTQEDKVKPKIPRPKKYKSVSKIDLSFNELKDNQVKTLLATILPLFPNLKELDLGYNPDLSSVSIRALVTFVRLSKSIQRLHLKGLDLLQLSDCQLFNQAAKRNPNFQGVSYSKGIRQMPGFSSYCVHYLDCNLVGLPKLLNQDNTHDLPLALWPIILVRANIVLQKAAPKRRANAIYQLIRECDTLHVR